MSRISDCELQQYEVPLSVCARLLHRLNLDHLRDRLDELEADQIDDLIIMIPARSDLDTEDFPTVTTDWDEIVGYTPLHSSALCNYCKPELITTLLAAGADPKAYVKFFFKTPWDLAQENEKLKGSKDYWALNDARFK